MTHRDTFNSIMEAKVIIEQWPALQHRAYAQQLELSPASASGDDRAATYSLNPS
jgi:hypothetical protein